MDRATYWATRSPLPQYEAIAFDHPAFDAPIRLVANQFAEVTLAGNVHTPAPMSVKLPELKSDAQPRLTLTFPRQVVGREFKQQLGLIKAAGSREPITVTYSSFLGDTATPQTTWDMYVADSAGVTFNAEGVQVTATIDNPMRRIAGVIYDPAVFTGLGPM